MPVLYCQPTMGLANRLMFLLASMRIARKLNYEFIPIWNREKVDDDSQMGCSIHDLFANIPISKVDVNSLQLTQCSTIHGRNFIDVEALKGRDIFVKGFHFLMDIKDLVSVTNDPSYALIISKQIALEWSQLIPHKFLYESVNYNYDIGIHIRRSTFIRSVNPNYTKDWSYPSDNDLIKFIHEIIVDINIKKIFLCSASEKTMHFLRSQLSMYDVECSNTNAWDLGVSAVQNAFIDMLNLANCSVIFRHRESTFSALPSLISAQKEYVYSDNGDINNLTPLIFNGAGL
jgi:hypothetical protein